MILQGFQALNTSLLFFLLPRCLWTYQQTHLRIDLLYMAVMAPIVEKDSWDRPVARACWKHPAARNISQNSVMQLFQHAFVLGADAILEDLRAYLPAASRIQPEPLLLGLIEAGVGVEAVVSSMSYWWPSHYQPDSINFCKFIQKAMELGHYETAMLFIRRAAARAPVDATCIAELIMKGIERGDSVNVLFLCELPRASEIEEES
jgi:hypothetical protein